MTKPFGKSMLITLRFGLVWAWFLIFILAMLPLALILPRTQVANAIFTRCGCPVAFWILGVRLDIENRDEILGAHPCIYIFNHQNLLDLFIPTSVMPRKTVTIVKSSLRWIPLFGWLAFLSGHLFIERKVRDKALATMDRARDSILKRKTSVLLSPEGTRSEGRGLLPFKKGAFHLALATRLPLVPIVISPYLEELHLERWRAGTIRVRGLAPIRTGSLTQENLDQFIEHVHASMKSAIEEIRTVS